MSKNDEPLFKLSTESLADEAHGYLGDSTVVAALLRNTVGAITAAVGKPSADVLLRKACRATGRTLLGQNPAYTPLRNWNEPGRIDVFVAKWAGSSEVNPLDRMEHGVLRFAEAVLELVDYAGQPGVLEEQWQWQLDALIEKWTCLFMGVSPAVYDAMI